jgi:hypothetical protein
MSIKRKAFSRAGTLAAAIAVVLGALVPAVVPMVSAASQVQTRSMEMSDSTPSHSGTIYQVTFTPQTTGAHSIIIDFCNNSSIIGGACTTDGTSIDTSAATYTAGTGMPGGWAIDHTGLASNTTVLLKDTAGTNNLGTSAVTFTLGAVTNPTYTGTFWARIYTYGDNSYGSTTTAYTAAATIGDDLDYGGFALSTTTLINITATVMETLTFCTSKSAPGALCTGTDAPNLVLGHGTPLVLDSTAVDTDTAHFQISTNALTGAVVRMKSHNACINGGLSRDGGATCPIPGIGAFALPSASTALFGLHLTTVAGGTGTVTADSDYDGNAQPTFYGMGNTTIGGTNDPTSTYGADIATTTGTASANVNELMTFAAQASVTTPAGVYSANESLIATGTF